MIILKIYVLLVLIFFLLTITALRKDGECLEKFDDIGWIFIIVSSLLPVIGLMYFLYIFFPDVKAAVKKILTALIKERRLK